MAVSMRAWSLAMSLLKIRKMFVAQSEKSFQSSFGAPSSSQMIGIGYGSQRSATSSQEPRSAKVSTSPFTTSRMNGRRRSVARGVKAGEARRRNRVCSGPSIDRIERVCRSLIGPSTPAICGRTDSAEWNRRSRRIAVTSSWRVTA